MRIKLGREGGWLPCIHDTGNNAIFAAVSLVSREDGREDREAEGKCLLW